MRSGKRKLCDITAEIVHGGQSDMLKQINDAQIDAFHEYENEIRCLKYKNSDLVNERNNATRRMHLVQKQLTSRDQALGRERVECLKLKKRVEKITEDFNDMRDTMDALNMEIFEVTMKSEEDKKYYKELTAGLQKSLRNMNESAEYLNLFRKFVSNFYNGISAEDSMSCTERKCVICLTMPANIYALPCRHLEWCCGCAIETFSLRHDAFDHTKDVKVNTNTKCGRCNEAVDSIGYLYL